MLGILAVRVGLSSTVALPFVKMVQYSEYETTEDSGIHQRGTQITKETSVVEKKDFRSQHATRLEVRFMRYRSIAIRPLESKVCRLIPLHLTLYFA
jgi:hypothetical protein